MPKNKIRSLLAILVIWIIATALTHKATANKIKDAGTTKITSGPSVVMKMATPLNSIGRSHSRIYHSK